MNANKAISIITALLVLFLAGAAFVLSYDALYALALANGIRTSLSWLWPLTLDAFMIAASLAVLRASLSQERTAYPWLLVGAFTLASITFNAIHAPGTWLARAIFMLPPAVVFLSFELLMSQIKATVKRQGAMLSVNDLSAEAEAKRQQVDTLAADAARWAGKLEAIQAEVKQLRQEKRQAIPTTGDDTRERARDILAERSDISGAELGRLLGRSESLGRQLKRELLPAIGSTNGKEKDPAQA
jgi:hypothetical protein